MSEFGMGCTYCLGLFLAHAERDLFRGTGVKEEDRDKEMLKGMPNTNPNHSFYTELWFNGASDHLYDLQIPLSFSQSLQKRLKRFQRKVLHWGHGFGMDVTKEDKIWAIDEAKTLLRLIDKEIGIKTKKGDWE